MANLRRQFSNRASRPNRTWAGAIPAAISTVPAASKVLLASATLSNPGIDETILRVVGQLGVGSDQTAAPETVIGAVGMCLVTDTALAVGVSSLPDPVTDVQDDIWFMYQAFVQKFEFESATGTTPNFLTQYAIDSKAKRIWHSGMSLAIVAANAHASQGLQLAFPNRVLTQVRGTR